LVEEAAVAIRKKQQQVNCDPAHHCHSYIG